MFVFRQHVGGAYHPELMFIFGGQDGGGGSHSADGGGTNITEIRRYDSTGNAALTGKNLAADTNYGVSATSLGKKIYLFKSTIQEWDGANISTKNTLPTNYYFNTSGTLGASAYMFGGAFDTPIYRWDGETRYSDSGSLGATGRCAMSASTLGSAIFLFGGDQSSSYLTSTILEFTGSGVSVHAASMPTPGPGGGYANGQWPETAPATAPLNSNIYVFGGNISNYKKIGKFDGSTYTEESALLTENHYEGDACYFNNKIQNIFNNGYAGNIQVRTWDGSTAVNTGWYLPATYSRYGFAMAAISK